VEASEPKVNNDNDQDNVYSAVIMAEPSTLLPAARYK